MNERHKTSNHKSKPPLKTIITKALGVALLLAATAPTSSHAQNLLSNGDFELPEFSSPPFFRYLTNTNYATQLGKPLPGWTVLDDGIQEPPYLGKLPTYTNVVHHGSYGIALNQGSGIRTTFATESNAIYRLSFWLRLQGTVTPLPLQVTIAGVVTNVPITTSWTDHFLQFTAATTDPVAVVQFSNVSPVGNFQTIGLDEISLVKFPLLQARLLPVEGRLLPFVSLDGGVGRTYRVEYVDSLSDTNAWQTFTNIVLSSSPFLLFDTQSTNAPQRFYRATEL